MEEDELKFGRDSSPMFTENEVFEEDIYKGPAEGKPAHRVRLTIPVTRMKKHYSTPTMEREARPLTREKNRIYV